MVPTSMFCKIHLQRVEQSIELWTNSASRGVRRGEASKTSKILKIFQKFHGERWPRPLLSGAAYGLMCAVMALVGDLTVSLLKRSAGVKDTGSLLPGHGGLLDRLDSYLLVSAPAYFFVNFLLRQWPVWL